MSNWTTWLVCNCFLRSLMCSCAENLNCAKRRATSKVPLQVMFGYGPTPAWQRTVGATEAKTNDGTGLKDENLGDLAPGKRGQLGRQARHMLEHVGCPEVQRVGIPGNGENCSFHAVMWAANAMVDVDEKKRPFRNVPVASQVQVARNFRTELAASLTQEMLHEVEETRNLQVLRRELKQQTSLGSEHLRIIAPLLGVNIFIVETNQTVTATERTAQVLCHCASNFEEDRNSIALHARQTNLVASDDGEEVMSDGEAEVTAGGHFEAIQLKAGGSSCWASNHAVVKVSLCGHAVHRLLQALCKQCNVGDASLGDPELPHYQHRVEAKASILRNIAAMTRKHNKHLKVREFKIGELVGVLVPGQDRKRHTATNFAGIVVEALKMGYRVR
jgi:hypothetical protein